MFFRLWEAQFIGKDNTPTVFVDQQGNIWGRGPRAGLCYGFRRTKGTFHT